MTFHSIVKQAYGDDVEKSGEVLMEIQQNLNDLVEEKAELEEDPVVLTPELLTNVMEESGVAPEKAEKIGKTCAEEFAEEAPLAENVVDSKALAANEQIQNVNNSLLNSNADISVLSNDQLLYSTLPQQKFRFEDFFAEQIVCLLYTSPSPRD